MHPISRKVSGDRTMAGRTTHHGLPTSMRVGKTGAHNDARHNYFRFHARSGPSMRDSMGHFGSGDDGHVHLGAQRSKGGTLGDGDTESTIVVDDDSHTPSFGTPHVRPELYHVGRTKSFLQHVKEHAEREGPIRETGKRRVIDLIEDIGENKPKRRGKSRVREAIDDVETMLSNKKPHGSFMTDEEKRQWKNTFGNHTLFGMVMDEARRNPIHRGRGLYA